VYAHPQDPRRAGASAGIGRTMSLRSSPSHEPVPLPMFSRPRNVGQKKPAGQTGKPHPLRQATVRKPVPPARVESTQPRGTSTELESTGEEMPREGETAESATQLESHESMADGQEEYATPADMSEMEGPQRAWRMAWGVMRRIRGRQARGTGRRKRRTRKMHVSSSSTRTMLVRWRKSGSGGRRGGRR
jgi:hypothetical protein